MKTVLDRLHPLRKARERRAQRQYHEDSEAHYRALAQQMAAQRELGRKQSSHSQARAAAMTDKPIDAAQATAALQYAEVLGARVGEARSRLEARTQHAEAALDKARESRRAYAHEAQVNEAIEKICAQLASTAELRSLQTEEALADEDFSAVDAIECRRPAGVRR